MKSILFCRLSFFCGLVLGISLLWSGAATNAANAASAPVGAVEESESYDVGGVLEFRIAPQKPGSGTGTSPVTKEEIAQCRKDLAANGPMAAKSRNDRFVWVEITSGVKVSENLITGEYRGAACLLVHNRAPFVIWPGTGWGLLSVRKGAADNMGRPYIGFRFDRVGADLFYNLTSANIDEALAIIVDGKVVSAPTISTAVGSQAVISGDFTREQIDEMVKVLRKDVLPAPGSTTAPRSATAPRVIKTYVIAALLIVLGISTLVYFVYR
ncbi:MAG: hypothetical protein CEE38_13065 [Planctomycetes bacterium B3_Pla]|nr:MAG: hypothetical protein CEE38_13065 [Planctomycetes bacterium B3_Pla]